MGGWEDERQDPPSPARGYWHANHAMAEGRDGCHQLAYPKAARSNLPPTHTHRHIVSMVERNFTQPFPDWYCMRLPAPSSLYPKNSKANNGHERAFELLPWPSNLNGLMVAVNTALFQDWNWLRLADITRALSYEGQLLTVCSAQSCLQHTEKNYHFKPNWGFL